MPFFDKKGISSDESRRNFASSKENNQDKVILRYYINR